MDKVVDHLLVFKGQGVIKDFPGNYTQYRLFEDKEQEEIKGQGAGSKGQEVLKGQGARGIHNATLCSAEKGQESKPLEPKKKLSYKEKREMEQLEKDIAALEAEKKQIEEALCGGTTSVDDITAMSKRLPLLNDELDEKSMRWLELSDIEH